MKASTTKTAKGLSKREQELEWAEKAYFGNLRVTAGTHVAIKKTLFDQTPIEIVTNRLIALRILLVSCVSFTLQSLVSLFNLNHFKPVDIEGHLNREWAWLAILLTITAVSTVMHVLIQGRLAARLLVGEMDGAATVDQVLRFHSQLKELAANNKYHERYYSYEALSKRTGLSITRIKQLTNPKKVPKDEPESVEIEVLTRALL